MDYSLLLMGTRELEKTIYNDLEDLIKSANECSLKPITLVVGKFFIEVTAVKMLQDYLNIKTDTDWFFELDQNLDIISTLYNDEFLKLYNICDKNNNILDYDPQKKIDMFVNPDEEYMYLICIDDTPETKQKMKKKQEIEFKKICFKKDEILYQFSEFLFS